MSAGDIIYCVHGSQSCRCHYYPAMHTSRGVFHGSPACSWCGGFGFVRSSIDVRQPECPCVDEADVWIPAGAIMDALFGWLP